MNCKSLTSVTIGENVTHIRDSAFENCSSLKNVYFKPTTPPLLGGSVFSNNASDRKFYVPTESVLVDNLTHRALLRRCPVFSYRV